MRHDLVTEINRGAVEMAAQYRIPVLDLSPLSLAAAAGDGSLIKDYVHPSDVAAGEWVQLFAHHIGAKNSTL